MSIFSDILKAIFQSEDDIDRSAGTTPETAQPLKRVLPLICPYNRLEEDIKYNFEQDPSATKVHNYRTINFGALEYPIIVTTSRSKDGECSCDYAMPTLSTGKLWVFFNIYEFLDIEFLLKQIREKKDGVYVYKQTPEIRKKLPTFCSLMNNAEKVNKDCVVGLPFITFIDTESKYPLLGAWFNESDIEQPSDTDKLYIALWKILGQMLKEMDEAGILDQTVKNLRKSFLRLAKFIYLIN